jgi:solute carrier family 50 protein (sugar transporter)
VFGFGAMLLSTLYLSKGAKRLAIIGWICLVFNISVFAAPLFVLVRIFNLCTNFELEIINFIYIIT